MAAFGDGSRNHKLGFFTYKHLFVVGLDEHRWHHSFNQTGDGLTGCVSVVTVVLLEELIHKHQRILANAGPEVVNGVFEELCIGRQDGYKLLLMELIDSPEVVKCFELKIPLLWVSDFILQPCIDEVSVVHVEGMFLVEVFQVIELNISDCLGFKCLVFFLWFFQLSFFLNLQGEG